MNILTEILGAGTSNLLKGVGDVLDNLVTSKEERGLIEVELNKIIAENNKSEKEIIIKELETWTADMESARKADVARAKSSSFLQKNIVPILAIFWTLITVGVITLVLIGTLVASEALIMLVVNGLFNIVMLIIGFYFGSSNGEAKAIKDYNKTIKK